MDLQVPSTSDGEFISQEALVSENLGPKEPWPCEGKAQAAVTSSYPSQPWLHKQQAGLALAVGILLAVSSP